MTSTLEVKPSWVHCSGYCFAALRTELKLSACVRTGQRNNFQSLGTWEGGRPLQILMLGLWARGTVLNPSLQLHMFTFEYLNVNLITSLNFSNDNIIFPVFEIFVFWGSILFLVCELQLPSMQSQYCFFFSFLFLHC